MFGVLRVARRGFAQTSRVSMRAMSTEAAEPTDAASATGKKKNARVVKSKVEIDSSTISNEISVADDVFRANTLAGLGDKFHRMNRAFDLIREGTALTPEMESDLAHIYDVTSLRTADSKEIRKAKTKALIEHYQRRPGDTGSTEVQLILLQEKINYLQFHMTRNHKDAQLVLFFSNLIVRRRKFLQYLRRERFRTYQIICRDLGIDEDEFWKVGRLPRNRPYYDPNRPKTRRLISDNFKAIKYTKPGTPAPEQKVKNASLIARTHIL
jgi:small subunit ribosomal protein S15